MPTSAVRAFDEDPEAAVAVLTGSGGHFCAGADLEAVGTSQGNTVQPEGDGPMGPTRMKLGKPVIAAVEGYAVAGRLELAVWADRVSLGADALSGAARFRAGQVRHGAAT